MAQLDILICSLNKGIVRVDEMLNSPDERVRSYSPRVTPTL